jgi:hypothetical protein
VQQGKMLSQLSQAQTAIDQLSISTSVSAVEYHSTLALSNSGMRKLAVSPYRYWFEEINPDRQPCEPTPEQKFGTALHCLVLEGEKVFHQRYARMVDESDYPDCLITIDDLRCWLRDKGFTPKGTRKAELVQQVLLVDPTVQIWDLLCAENEQVNADKMLCLKDDWDRIHGATEALLSEPKLRELLKHGEPEVALFANEPATHAPLKAKLDWLTSDCILDLKTFTQKRGKSIDQSIADAIFYECYYRQAYFYATLHQQLTKQAKPIKVVMAFVESDPPYEVRIKELRPASQGVTNLYWQRARIECQSYCALWAECMREFGAKPWRTAQKIEPLQDEEMKGLAFS